MLRQNHSFVLCVLLFCSWGCNPDAHQNTQDQRYNKPVANIIQASLERAALEEEFDESLNEGLLPVLKEPFESKVGEKRYDPVLKIIKHRDVYTIFFTDEYDLLQKYTLRFLIPEGMNRNEDDANRRQGIRVDLEPGTPAYAIQNFYESNARDFELHISNIDQIENLVNF